MSSFCRNPFSSKPIDQQWMDYLENRAGYEDLSASENSALVAHRDAQDSALAMRESAALVSSSLADGISGLSAKWETNSSRLEEGLWGLQSSLAGGIEEFSGRFSDQMGDFSGQVSELSDQIGSLESSLTKKLSGLDETMKRGFVGLMHQLEQTSARIDLWANRLETNQQLQLQAQRIQILQSENLALLLRIPDVQKERQYYVEQGLKFFKNGVVDREMYEYALDNLNKALEIERTDYVVLFHLGMIRLFVPHFLDLEAAVGFFKKAGQLASVESDPSAARIFNILTGDFSRALKDQADDPRAVQKLAGEAYGFASRSFFLQGRWEDCVQMADKALILVPDQKEIVFLKAKALCLLGQDALLAPLLRPLIESDSAVTLRLVADPDLGTSTAIKALLRQLRDEVNTPLAQFLKDLRPYLTPSSLAYGDFQRVEELVAKNSYLDGLEANRMVHSLKYQVQGRVFSFSDMVVEEQRTRLHFVAVLRKSITTVHDQVPALVEFLSDIEPMMAEGKAKAAVSDWKSTLERGGPFQVLLLLKQLEFPEEQKWLEELLLSEIRAQELQAQIDDFSQKWAKFDDWQIESEAKIDTLRNALEGLSDLIRDQESERTVSKVDVERLSQTRDQLESAPLKRMFSGPEITRLTAEIKKLETRIGELGPSIYRLSGQQHQITNEVSQEIRALAEDKKRKQNSLQRDLDRVTKERQRTLKRLEAFLNIGSLRPIEDGFVFVHGGTFTMGNQLDWESPPHRVTVSSFTIGVHPVTVRSFRDFVEATGYMTTREIEEDPKTWASPGFSQQEDYPVVAVSWYDAVAYANWLSTRDGYHPVYSCKDSTDARSWPDWYKTQAHDDVSCNWKAVGYRLPTEAEWEFAARGGNLSRNSSYAGSEKADEVAWYDKNSGESIHRVGMKNPNELGLFDMSGNVSEWCWDWKGDYSSEDQLDPRGPGFDHIRVLRGGDWTSWETSTMVSHRNSALPFSSGSMMGFRLVLP